jgi:hypothetical protein
LHLPQIQFFPSQCSKAWWWCEEEAVSPPHHLSLIGAGGFRLLRFVFPAVSSGAGGYVIFHFSFLFFLLVMFFVFCFAGIDKYVVVDAPCGGFGSLV